MTTDATGSILSLVTWFQILVRTETAGGPEGPPLFFYGKNFMAKPFLTLSQQVRNLKERGKFLAKALSQPRTPFSQNLRQICSFFIIFGYTYLRLTRGGESYGVSILICYTSYRGARYFLSNNQQDYRILWSAMVDYSCNSLCRLEKK